MKGSQSALAAKTSNWAVCLLSASLLATGASVWLKPGPVVAAADKTARPNLSGESREVLTAVQDAFVRIGETVEPAVVTVTARPNVTERPAASQQDDNTLDVPEPFRQFFRGVPQPDAPESRRGTSTGSGVIIRESGNTGYVLTNNHVVDGQERFRVQLADGTMEPATLVGRDERADLAVLKFQARKPLPAGSVARLGNSDVVRPGQWAIAIGSPLGYESTLTVGVVSAKGRALDGVGRSAASYVDLIQTDASINPGNSGGPLVNLDGEVIGINVAIASSGASQGNIGIGFAIPSNTARAISDQLISQGKVVRGYLGVSVSEANREMGQELRDHFNAPEGGALLEVVQPDSPAAKGGLAAGDVVVRFGGSAVHNFTDLEKAVSSTAPGKSAPVEVIRNGRLTRLTVTLAERPSEGALLKENGGRGPRGEQGERPFTPSRYGLSVRAAAGGSGVEVGQVKPGSPASEAGLSAGDVVLRVGNTPTPDVNAFQQALNAAPANSGIVLRVQTPSGLRFVILRP